MHAAAGEPPDQKGVDRAEQHLSPHGPLADAGHRLEKVEDLRGREVGVEEQPRPPADLCLVPLRLEPCADRRGDATLPDHRRCHGPAGRAIPEDRRLPLVGDPDRCHVIRGDTGRGEHAACAGKLSPPDVLWIVLDDAEIATVGAGRRAGVLRKLLLHDGQRCATVVEEDCAAGGRALVKRQHAGLPGHRRFSRFARDAGAHRRRPPSRQGILGASCSGASHVVDSRALPRR